MRQLFLGSDVHRLDCCRPSAVHHCAFAGCRGDRSLLYLATEEETTALTGSERALEC
jgi:hypothetical protein